MYPQSMFGAKIRKLSFFSLLKIFIFKNLCILHGHVFIMHAPLFSDMVLVICLFYYLLNYMSKIKV